MSDRAGQSIWPSPLAGRWYPADPASLLHELAKLDPQPASMRVAGVRALIVPHAGYAYSGRVALAAYAQIDPDAYDRVVVIGPSHAVAMENRLSALDVQQIRTPLGPCAVDIEFLHRLRATGFVIHEPSAHIQEHSDQIQLPLLQRLFGDRPWRVAPLVCGAFSPAATTTFGHALRALLDARTLLVISTDFTHYGPNFNYVPFAGQLPERLHALDHRVFAQVAACDATGFRQVMQETGATVCGEHPLALLIAVAGPHATVCEVAYDQSGRMTHDWQHSVSYSERRRNVVTYVAGQEARPEVYMKQMLNQETRAWLVALARQTIDTLARQKPQDVPVGAQQVMGGFVTLTMAGALRGCIGEIFPRRNIWHVVSEQALNAALHDPRFPPLTADEAPQVKIEISALTPPAPVASWRDIILDRHGIVLEKGGGSAVFLPQVPGEQGWNLATTLRQLSHKAGLPANAWEDNARFLVFEAEIFGEEN